MKAVRIHTYSSDPKQLLYEDAPMPHTSDEEVLVQVHAAGITPTELSWAGIWKNIENGVTRPLPLILGHEFSGVIKEVGNGVTEVNSGEEVYGLIDFIRDGAEAEYAIARLPEIAPKPKSLDHTHSAAVPLSALTAWQALFDHGNLVSGEKILIHGAAGGVGSFAVQFAKWAGADEVIGTASSDDTEFLFDIGADNVIDYTTRRFEGIVQNIDIVFDTVGGDTLERSWKVLKKGTGKLVCISVVDMPSSEHSLPLYIQKKGASHGVHATWFIVKPNRSQLTRIRDLIDAGDVRPIVDTVLPLSQAQNAYEHPRSHRRGKIVLSVS